MKHLLAAAIIVIVIALGLIGSAVIGGSSSETPLTQGSGLTAFRGSEPGYHTGDSDDRVRPDNPALSLLASSPQVGSAEMVEMRRMFPRNLMLPGEDPQDTSRQKFHERLDDLSMREPLGISRAEALELYDMRIRKKKDLLQVITFVYDKTEHTLSESQKEEFQTMIAQQSTSLNGYVDKLKALRTTGD